MSSRYTADGKRKSSMTHARRVYVCLACGKKLRGNGARSSHTAMHERKGEEAYAADIFSDQAMEAYKRFQNDD